MAVYTTLNRDQVSRFLAGFGWSQVHSLKATERGIENTNYFVEASEPSGEHHQLVITLFERANDHLPYYVSLLTFLGERGLPVPKPFTDQRGETILSLKGKSALVVPRLPGAHIATPSAGQCQAIGSALSKIHNSSSEFSGSRTAARGAKWRMECVQQLSATLDSKRRALLQELVQEWDLALPELNQLPTGITHGDLFHDNALFIDDQLTGIIDFDNACQDLLLYDLAVLVNDWCSLADCSLETTRYQALTQAYSTLRPLTQEEQRWWPTMLTYAALRFWISRLMSWQQHGDSAVTQKCPAEMERLVRHRLANPAHWPE